MIYRLKSLLFLASLMIGGPVVAQDIGGVFDMSVMTGTASMDPVIEQSREMAIRKEAQDPLPGRSRSLPITRSLKSAFMSAPRPSSENAMRDRSTLTYRPSAAVRRANFASFVERLRAIDPEDAVQLEKDLNGNVMDAGEAQLKPHGLTSTNVADAATTYLATAWFGARGRVDDPSPAQTRALQSQLASAMLSSTEFQSASDAQKQEVAEAMILQSIMIAQHVEAARDRPEYMASVRTAVANGARNAFGIDVNSIALTDAGLQ